MGRRRRWEEEDEVEMKTKEKDKDTLKKDKCRAVLSSDLDIADCYESMLRIYPAFNTIFTEPNPV